MSKKFYTMITQQSIDYQHVVEVGVYKPETANTLGFINEGTQCTLFEANPTIAKELREKLANQKNATVYPFAICGYDGVTKLYDIGASAFTDNIVNPPAIAHDNYLPNENDAIEVECRKFSHVDNGDIDILSIDIEGGEWEVIKEMKSRPNVLSIETQSRDYINPHLDEITDWLDRNDYKIWFVDDTDTVFVKKELVQLSLILKFKARIHSDKFFDDRLIE